MSEFDHWTLVLNVVNVVIQAVLAVGSLGVITLALFGEQIKDWWFGPSLKLSVQLEPPYCQRFSNGTWFRVKVENQGKTAARGVEVWLVDLSRHEQGAFLPQNLVSVPLIWTHTNRTTADSVNPSFHRYVDLGSLVQNEGVYSTTSNFVIALPYIVLDSPNQLPPGRYAGRFAVTASNAPVRYWNFRFEVPSSLMPTEAEALRNVNLRII